MQQISRKKAANLQQEAATSQRICSNLVANLQQRRGK
jgi:hypothetical protein